MSGWRQAVNDGDDEDRALVSEDLVRDDGRFLGGILCFDEHGPTYAWSHHGRIGPCSPAMPYVAGGPLLEPDGSACDAAARRAVERALEASTSSARDRGGRGAG
jgi:hypothetical protein